LRPNRLTLLALLILLLTACDSTPTPTPMPPAPTPAASNAALLVQAAANMRQLKSYRIEAEGVEVSDGRTGSFSGDVDVAGSKTSLRITFSSTLTVRLISIGPTTYISPDDGQTWEQKQVSVGEVINKLTSAWLGLQQSEINRAGVGLQDASPLMAVIDGVQCKHLTAAAAVLPTVAKAGSTFNGGTVELWLSADSRPLIRQLRISGDSNGLPNSTTIKISDFDAEFVINAPTTLSQPTATVSQ